MVYGTCLENKRAGNGTVGSNPTPSARKISPTLVVGFSFLVRKSGIRTQCGSITVKSLICTVSSEMMDYADRHNLSSSVHPTPSLFNLLFLRLLKDNP